MPRDGAIIFGDLVGKLDPLRIECPKCGRSGRYRVADLIMRYGRDAKLFAFTDDVTASCARKSPSPSGGCRGSGPTGCAGEGAGTLLFRTRTSLPGFLAMLRCSWKMFVAREQELRASVFNCADPEQS
jgi:hypothetical protein